MTIIFYTPEKNCIYLSSERESIKKIDLSDPNLISLVPNDDILYVQTGCYITKQQFQNWLNGNMNLSDTNSQNMTEEVSTGQFIHPAHHGTIFIGDIKTQKFPHGITLNGKWDFLSVDEIGVETLENSAHYRILLKKGKIKLCDADYVRKNQHKKLQKMSAAEAALDAILIKDSRSGAAERIAHAGGIQSTEQNDIEFLVQN